MDPGNRKRQANKMYELDLAVNSLIWKKTFLSDYQLATFAVKKKKKKWSCHRPKILYSPIMKPFWLSLGLWDVTIDQIWPAGDCCWLPGTRLQNQAFFSFCNYEAWDSELANTPAFQIIARKERFYQFYWSLKGIVWLNNKKKVTSSAL